jgi:Uncharacterized protein conserved in bacteria C-term(DUF2220).
VEKSKLIEFKKKNSRKNISLDEIMNLYKIYDHLEAVKIVNEMQNKGYIVAKKSKKLLTVQQPYISTKYTIEIAEDYTMYEDEIKYLHYKIQTDYLIKDIEERYIPYRYEILKMSKFLFENMEELNYRISINERSLQLFNNEKFISENFGLMSKLFNDFYSYLNIYPTPEPFMYYYDSNFKGDVLFIENKDTWYSIYLLMKEGKNKFFGKEFSCVVYGEGNTITSKIKGWESVLYKEFNSKDLYYFGDMDSTGLDIYYRANEIISISLFLPMYEYIIEYGQFRLNFKMQKFNENAKSIIDEYFFKYSSEIKEKFNENYGIPQEVLNKRILKEC